ncbi:IAPP isoform 2 [Pongo abelii]|uniref:IAPP isoform 2 n=1 Tax=Pongo abelii TaxID=9601 RepID=A0A2J8XXP4_PONAB|nr:IAPP isoform 2 [Pongo abelii]
MCILKLQVFLIVLSVALNHLKATPIERQEWITPVLSRNILLELRGAKPEHEAGKKSKIIRWKSGNATLPRVQRSAWQIF